MPYIEAMYRDMLEDAIETLAYNISGCHSTVQAGFVNYTISRLIFRLLRERGLSYAAINEMIGALECAKLELYRRVAANYEDKKIEQNGDVFDA